jgi:hypothetical protein
LLQDAKNFMQQEQEEDDGLTWWLQEQMTDNFGRKRRGLRRSEILLQAARCCQGRPYLISKTMNFRTAADKPSMLRED